MIQRVWATILFVLGLVIFASAAIIAYAPEAKADVSAQCWAHLAEIPAGETPAGDVRYHRAKGQFSPCTEQEAREASGASSSQGSKSYDDKPRHRRDSFGFHCGIFGCG